MPAQEFTIEIKNEKIKTYRLITFFIVIINVSFFFASLFNAGERKNAFASLAFILIYSFYRLYRLNKRKQAFYFDEGIYFILMILWINNYAAAIACALMCLLYTVSLQKIMFSFDSLNIRKTNFPWRKYAWTELSNVMIKDGLLTLDFKNNKLMQAEIASSDIDEKEFNDFATRQLHC